MGALGLVLALGLGLEVVAGVVADRPAAVVLGVLGLGLKDDDRLGPGLAPICVVSPRRSGAGVVKG